MKTRTERGKLELLADLVNTVTRNAHRNRSTKKEHRLIEQVGEQLIGRKPTSDEMFMFF